MKKICRVRENAFGGQSKSLDCVMQESTEKIDFLKYMTKQVFPKEADYFLKQMGKELHCSQGFAMRIILQWH